MVHCISSKKQWAYLTTCQLSSPGLASWLAGRDVSVLQAQVLGVQARVYSVHTLQVQAQILHISEQHKKLIFPKISTLVGLSTTAVITVTRGTFS